jgi:hypothetical protein
MRARLDAAGDLPGLLTVSRDAFGLIRAICRTSQDRSGELSAAFAIAATLAVHGRNLLTAAPSMPPARRVATLRRPAETASLESGQLLGRERVSGAEPMVSCDVLSWPYLGLILMLRFFVAEPMSAVSRWLTIWLSAC